jgi:predicted permease
MDPAVGALTRRLGERWKYPPQWDKTKNARLTPLREYLVGGMRPALLATLAAMAVILLIACANVAALMLGQVESRATELAVRSALGADRGRLTTQLVTEALAIGVLAAILGAGLATVGFNVLRGALSLGAWGERAALDWSVFAAAIVAALVGAVLVAFLPAIALWRGDLRVALGGVRTGGVLERRGGIQGMLVVGEVALAVLLAAGAALLVRSVSNLYAIRPGIETHGVAVIDIALPAGLEVPTRMTMLRRVVGDLAALPGVRSAALTHKLPLRGGGSSTGIRLEGDPDGPPPTTYFRIVSPGYFETLGIPLREGRLFNGSDLGVDTARAELTVIVNEALAKKFFPNRSPVGQRIIAGMGTPERIVGVVGDVAEAALTDPPAPTRYFVNEHVLWALDEQTLVIRTTRPQDAASILDAATRTIRSSAPSFAVQEATTIERVLDRAVGPARQVMALLTLLTALALILSAIGIYGVIAHFVARRRRDWSIRVALGLPPSRVIRQVVGHSSSLVAAGIVLGLVGAVVLARLLGALLYGVSTADPVSLVGVAVMLLSVGALAAFLPALRASRSDPAMVMREN